VSEILRCANCGELADCLGSYENNHSWAYACNSCCGHGNEDGCCFPLSDIPARYQAKLDRIAELEAAHVVSEADKRVAEELREKFIAFAIAVVDAEGYCPDINEPDIDREVNARLEGRLAGARGKHETCTG
jgi:hypothetical protein